MAKGLMLLAAIAAGITLGATSIVIAFPLRSDDPAEPPVGGQTPPIPVLNRWIRPDTGVFWNSNGPWDNRNLPPEEKAATPWFDPRWRPFGHCMRDAGFETRSDPGKPLDEGDIGNIISRLNRENPDSAKNRAIRPGDYSMGGLTAAFLECADRWLAITPDEFAKNGIQMLDPGEIPEP